MKMFSHRELELFQVWAKRAEVDWIIGLLKGELQELAIEEKRIQKLVNEEKKSVVSNEV